MRGRVPYTLPCSVGTFCYDFSFGFASVLIMFEIKSSFHNFNAKSQFSSPYAYNWTLTEVFPLVFSSNTEVNIHRTRTQQTFASVVQETRYWKAVLLHSSRAQMIPFFLHCSPSAAWKKPAIYASFLWGCCYSSLFLTQSQLMLKREEST